MKDCWEELLCDYFRDYKEVSGSKNRVFENKSQKLIQAKI